MSDPELERVCTRCGARNGLESVSCRLCASTKLEFKPALGLDLTAEVPRREHPPRPAGQPAASFSTFSLNTLFIGMTLSAVCFSLMRQSPFLAIVAGVTGLPALIVTYGFLNRFGVHRDENTIGHRIERFVASLMIFWGNWLLLFFAVLLTLAGIGLVFWGMAASLRR